MISKRGPHLKERIPQAWGGRFQPYYTVLILFRIPTKLDSGVKSLSNPHVCNSSLASRARSDSGRTSM